MDDIQDREFENNFEQYKNWEMHTYQQQESYTRGSAPCNVNPEKVASIDELIKENESLKFTIFKMAKFIGGTDIDEDICKKTGVCRWDCTKCIISFFEEV